MKTEQENHLPAPALPATLQDLLKERKFQPKRTLNNYVDDIHQNLWENEAYQRLLWAVWTSETVEGSIIANDLEAARMQRNYAKENGISVVASAISLRSRSLWAS